MNQLELKINKIREVITNFRTGIGQHPTCWGSPDEIESKFFVIDQIDQILTIGEHDNSELSWRAFLSYIGGFGPRTATQQIREMYGKEPTSKIYEELNKLREEYFKWRDIKLSSLENTENNSLLDLVPEIGNDQAEELVSWFIKHPSKKVVSLYETRIKKQYSKHETISLCLSSLGDATVLDWAQKNINNTKKRFLALKIIAASPTNDVNNIIMNVIKSNEIEDIIAIVEGYAYSANSNNVFNKIHEIIDCMEIPPLLNWSLVRTLSGPAHSNKKEAAILRDSLATLGEKAVGNSST